MNFENQSASRLSPLDQSRLDQSRSDREFDLGLGLGLGLGFGFGFGFGFGLAHDWPSLAAGRQARVSLSTLEIKVLPWCATAM
ncbi:MAG TPA: hypothetical protein VHB79_00815 [Polyangiaceae bacterium]|nr:hypothetical protein [Polyangiaceae bacterium]